MGVEIALAGLLALAAVLLILYFRSVRTRSASDAPPLLVGFFRGCAVVLVAIVASTVVTAILTGVLYDPETMSDRGRDFIRLMGFLTIGLVILLGWRFRRSL